jgi:superfamily II helicase
MKNEYLRHTLATIDYRFQKSVKYRNSAFGDYTLGKESRTPKEIINHMYFVISSTTIYILEEKVQEETPEKLSLELEIDRFNSEMKNLDKVLSENDLEMNYSKRLLQGPLSDILTHIGQISMLSRLNNNPIEWEDFSSSPIQTGAS